jgi:hypothetical protein
MRHVRWNVNKVARRGFFAQFPRKCQKIQLRCRRGTSEGPIKPPWLWPISSAIGEPTRRPCSARKRPWFADRSGPSVAVNSPNSLSSTKPPASASESPNHGVTANAMTHPRLRPAPVACPGQVGMPPPQPLLRSACKLRQQREGDLHIRRNRHICRLPRPHRRLVRNPCR